MMITLKYKMSNDKGFTIIEMVMVIVLIGILAGIGAPLIGKLVESLDYSVHGKGLTENADISLRRMGREIPRLQNTTSVLTANATTYRFVNIDGNTIQFTLNGTNLERFDGTFTDVLAANVSSFSFSYLDATLGPITTPQVSPNSTDIKFIDIDFILTLGSNSAAYTMRIRLRNVVHPSNLFS